MGASRRLAWAWARRHRLRMLLTASAMALATSLVVFTVTGYRAAVERNAGFARQILGTADVLVLPRYAMQPTIDAGLDRALAADDAVVRVDRGRAVYAEIEDIHDTTYYDVWRAAIIHLPPDALPVELASGEWPHLRSATAAQDEVVAGVVSGGLARRWRVGVGDELPLQASGGEHRLRVIGITDEFLPHGEASGVYVSATDFARVSGGTRPADRLLVDLADDVDRARWVADWSERLAASEPPAKALDVGALTSTLGADGAVKRLRSMGSSAAAIALLAAGFIVWTSVSAGAAEKRRELAMLRAIGATRRQVLAVVLWEAVVLALIGGAVGVPLGWLWLQILALIQSDFFHGLIVPGSAGVAAALVVTVLTGVLAGVLPAWGAARVAPLEAMAPTPARAERRVPWLRATLAAVLAAGAVAAVFTGDLLAIALGVPLTALAVVLAARPVVRLCQGPPARCLARAVGLTPDLMRLQHQAGARGAVGIVLTLAVCLGLSVTMNAWGRTMVIPFLPTPQLPDQVVSILPGGVPFAEVDAIGSVAGIDEQRVLPLAVEQLTLGHEFLAQTSGAVDELYVQVMGVDPQHALSAREPPLLPMRSEREVAAIAGELRRSGTCVIPATLAERFGIAVGDRLAVKRSGSVREEVELEVVALASLPGWQWVTKMGRMRSLGGKPVAPVVVGMDTVRTLGIANVRHWLVDTTPSFDRAAARAQLQTIAERHAGAYTHAHFGPGMSGQPSVKIISTGEVGRRLEQQADAVIWVLGAIPLASLLVAMLGVANAIAMGIRARSWTFGILRAVGLERARTGRLVVCEALVLGLAAGALSIPAGLLVAESGIDLSVQAFNTGTAAPALVVPWVDIAMAWAITIAAAVLAAWLPARALARREPLDLLAAGRAGVD